MSHSVVHVHYITGGTLSHIPCTGFYINAVLFVTPYSIITIIIIVVVIVIISTHQQKVTEFKK